MSAHGGEHVGGSAFAGENDDARMGAQTPDGAQEFDILKRGGLFTGENQIETFGEHAGQRVLIRGDVMDRPEAMWQGASEKRFQGRVGIDDEGIADRDWWHENSRR
jgi:hypothetical protein